MRSINRTFGLSVALIFSVFSLVTSAAIANAFAGQTMRVSVSSAGEAASEMPLAGGVISADGRYVVFWSAAPNLVPGVGNGNGQVYRHDWIKGETVLVSAGTTGAAGNGISRDPSVSEHGDFVVFGSTATDLIASDENGGMSDVFMRDMSPGGAITLVSANSANDQGDGPSTLSSLASGAREISDDGTYVVFMSTATNFDGNGMSQVYRKNITSGALELVSVNDAGDAGDLPSQNPSISGNGGTVAFNSAARNLSPFSTRGSIQQVFVREFPPVGPSGPTTLESRAAADTNSASTKPVLSSTGQYLAFESLGVLDMYDYADDNGTMDVYVRDRGVDNTTHLASRSPNKVPGAASFGPSISGDGRWVAYSSIDELVFGNEIRHDTNGKLADVFIYDRLSHRENPSLRYASLNDAGDQATLASMGPSLSHDGQLVLFGSAAPNLFERASSGFQLYVRNLLANQQPVVDAGPDVTLREGESLDRTASFTDADGSTFWTATVDFGSVDLDPGSKSPQISSEPLKPGSYLVTVAVTDNAGATGTDTFLLTVKNLDPQIVGLGTEAFLYFDWKLTRAVSLSDAGQNVPHPTETYWATVDYDDGATATFMGSLFVLDHTYTRPGDYVVRVTASDSNDGSSTGFLTVHVLGYKFEWADSVADRFVVGRNLPVKFTVRDADGSFVLDRSVQVDVVDAEGNPKVAYTFGDQPSRSVTVSGDSYHVNVDTRDLEAGTYTLRVRFSSPTLTATITLATNGTASAVRSRLRD